MGGRCWQGWCVPLRPAIPRCPVSHHRCLGLLGSALRCAAGLLFLLRSAICRAALPCRSLPDLAWLSSARLYLPLLGRLGSARLGSAQLGMARVRSAQLASERVSSARFRSAVRQVGKPGKGCRFCSARLHFAYRAALSCRSRSARLGFLGSAQLASALSCAAVLSALLGSAVRMLCCTTCLYLALLGRLGSALLARISVARHGSGRLASDRVSSARFGSAVRRVGNQRRGAGSALHGFTSLAALLCRCSRPGLALWAQLSSNLL